MSYFLLTLLMIVGLFLIAVILLQRGRGGGLAGAFGGLGGQSAFGTRAGDTFTWITVGTVVVWIILAAAAGRSIRSDMEGQFLGRESDEVKLAPARGTGSESDLDGGAGTEGKGLDLPDMQDFPVGPAPKNKPEGPVEGAGPAPSGPQTEGTEETKSAPAESSETPSKPAE